MIWRVDAEHDNLPDESFSPHEQDAFRKMVKFTRLELRARADTDQEILFGETGFEVAQLHNDDPEDWDYYGKP